MSKLDRRLAAIAIGLVLLVGISAFTSSREAQSPSLPPELEKLGASLDKYNDPYMAVRDGYLSTVGCVHYPHGGRAGHVPYRPGGMGVHFVNLKLIGPEPDPMRPPILIYEPEGDKLRLVAVEWFIPLATGVKERPSVYGQAFDGPMEGHEPLLPKDLHHYDLDAWLGKENPYGVFAPTNPDVNCGGYSHSLAEHAPLLVPHAMIERVGR